MRPEPMPRSPPIKASPQGPKLAKVSSVVIWVKVQPAKNPKGINQLCLVRLAKIIKGQHVSELTAIGESYAIPAR